MRISSTTSSQSSRPAQTKADVPGLLRGTARGTRILFALFAESTWRGQLCALDWSERCGRPRDVFVMSRSSVRVRPRLQQAR